jgi:hypothetical protein
MVVLYFLQAAEYDYSKVRVWLQGDLKAYDDGDNCDDRA